MKRIYFIMFLIACLLAIVSTYSFAASKFGPIIKKEKGKSSLGVEVFNYQNKWEPTTSGWDDIKSSQTQVSLAGEYSLSDTVQIYGNLGLSGMTIDGAFDEAPNIGVSEEDFNDSPSPFISIGIKGLFYEKDSLSLGAFLQTTAYGKYSDHRDVNLEWTDYRIGYPYDCEINVKEEATIKDQYDVNLGLTLQSTCKTSILYIGTFLYFNRASVDYTVTGKYTESSILYDYEESFDDSETCKYEEKANLGLFIGGDVDLGKDFRLNGELQIRNKPSLGLSISKNF